MFSDWFTDQNLTRSLPRRCLVSPLTGAPRQQFQKIASSLCSGAGVGVAIHVQKMRCVHRRINLCRGKAGVTEQLLKRAEVCSASQQVGCKAVPKSMGCEGLGQAQSTPRRRHRSADEVRVERTATRADEQRHIAGQRIWGLPDISFDRFAHCRQDRHNSGFRSLSRDAKRRADGQDACQKRESFCNA